ncbi:MAG: NAD-dependent epimerase/dehydratase family protein [Casimicrobiaceae bacterium]
MAGAGSDGRRIAVTGADGFIGRALVAQLARLDFDVRAITRASHGDFAAIDAGSLSDAVQGVHAIFHLAARAHVMHEREADPAAAFHSANVVATERVARAARDAGVMRFVLASSAKVNGESTPRGRPFRIDDAPAPQDAYAQSKWDAERALAEIAAGAAMTTVVLRLPLVYGPGVRGNFRTLWDAVARRQWLPFAAIDNRRSMIGLGNLADALVAAIAAPAGTYFVADADSVSTPQLARAIAAAQQVDARLAYVPVALLRLLGRLIGRRAAMERVTSSLEVDASHFRAASGCNPRETLAQGLAAIIAP